MSETKIEPCPVCRGNPFVSGRSDFRRFDCCGIAMTGLAKWNTYARERSVGRRVLDLFDGPAWGYDQIGHAVWQIVKGQNDE